MCSIINSQYTSIKYDSAWCDRDATTRDTRVVDAVPRGHSGRMLHFFAPEYFEWCPPPARSPRMAHYRLAKSLFSLPYFVLRIQLDLIFARALFPPIDGPELKCVSMCEIRILIHSRNPRSDHLNGTIGHQNRHSQQKLCNILPLWRSNRPPTLRGGGSITSF